jgi:phage baseplate assembly protein W
MNDPINSGMNAVTGTAICGIAHLRQSIRDILTTRLGTRLMRPDYGSTLPDLIDAPQNDLTVSRIVAATAGALRAWEPRYQITRVQVVAHRPGQIIIDLDGHYLVDGKAVKLEGLVL